MFEKLKQSLGPLDSLKATALVGSSIGLELYW